MGAELDPVIAILVALLVFTGILREWASPDTLAMVGASALVALGVLAPNELIAVFSNPGALTIGAMFVISGALQNTGVIEWLLSPLHRIVAASSPKVATMGLMSAVVVTSAFINNTAVIVVLTPIAIAMARQLSEAPSRWLIPLSYASIFGGSCTLIGTSTNLLVDGVASEHGLAPFTMFELTVPGALLALAGFAYLAVFGRYLLPDRRCAQDFLADYRSKRFLTELIISPDSEFVGRPASRVADNDTEVVQLMRGGRLLGSDADSELRPGDRVVVRATAGQALYLRTVALARESASNQHRAELDEHLLPAGFEVGMQSESVIREGIVGPGSHYEGRRVGSLNLRRHYDVRILAVHRQGGTMRRDFERVRLQMGDTLLLEGPPEGLKRLFDARELINLGEPMLRRFRKEKAPIVLGIAAAFVILAAFGVMPIVALALIAASAMLLAGCLSPQRAYEAIDWKILFLVFGMLAIGRALDASGSAEVIVRGLIALAGDLSPWVVLAIVYLIASVLTELITNNAVAIVLTPIAIALAGDLGLDPRPFAVAVMFAGSASFATPLGYQTNTFVYGAGNYRFVDFV
ncbi:MAG: SLC13 family permease, partial [Gammaproteobacteria bacterium]